MTRPIIAVLVYGVLLGAPMAAHAAPPKCLADDPAAAEDTTDLAAVRAQIETECPCDTFTPTGKKNAHPAYVKCAKEVVKAALEAGQLRKQCQQTALYPANRSICGYPLLPARAPCVYTSPKGAVSCKVTPTCEGARYELCAEHENCLDATDTNHDGQVSSGDSGECNPPQNCADQKAQALVRADAAVTQCYNGCSQPLYIECVFGCVAATNDLEVFIDAEYAACQAHPTASCEVLHALNLAYCATVPSPPPTCVAHCFGDPFCEQKCASAADCAREVGDAYDYCVQTSN